MTRNAMPEKRQSTLAPLEEEVDHVRGPTPARLILEYGDYECPYSRQAFREIGRIEQQLGDGVRFAFRHFPLTEIHPHALAAACAAEAAAIQGRFWADVVVRGEVRIEGPASIPDGAVLEG